MTDSITQQITDAMIEVAKTRRITGLTITHEAFDSVKAEAYGNAPDLAPNMIELKTGKYWFGAIPITRVTDLPDDATNPHFTLTTGEY